MERFQELLLDVWREACRHIEIGESSATLLRMFQTHMPLQGLILHRFETEQHRAVVAAAVPESLQQSLTIQEELTAGQFRALAQWARKGDVARIDKDRGRLPPLATLSALADQEGPLLTVPLRAPHGTLGAATLIPGRGHRFAARHEDMLRRLQEPLAVALENDRRLHELNLLRAAAEADRSSLLRRLGREELTDAIVGAESGLRLVLERVRQIARSDVPALILGETGTGKELIARAIHSGSSRKDGPFIRVNCGAIPTELIDSQLFGHEKGSFTGAVEARPGWFERADGGTLFLDEIGELPANAQVRFLRVLQDGFVERVGGHRSIHVNVRVIAATHRDLAGMVNAGTFREDLWYRIAVFPILIPPLRDRREDIPQLVEHFAQKAAVRFGLSPVHATTADLALLQAYHWPGNIRELGAVIDRAAILGDGRTLEIATSLGIGRPTPPMQTPSSQRSLLRESPFAAESFPTLHETQRLQIERALEATSGRIEGPHGVAHLLDINPHTLRARMRKLGIDWKKYRNPGPPRSEASS